jgi:tetraacyldisaccharide 4'-kinase
VILSPLSALYGRAVSLRARWYANGRLASEALPLPSVAVGNLTFGGTGKTPFTEFLARRFRFEGRRPAILSRGYGRRSRGVVVVAAGNGPIVSPEDGGDEPVAMARSAGAGMIVVVGERRADAARRAAELGADLLLLDDAYQHLAVRRDANLLLLDARDPFAGGRLPPAGRLREPLDAIARADAVVLTRVNRGEPPRGTEDEIARRNPRAPVFRATIRATGLSDEAGARIEPAEVASRRAISVCGVANPAEFAATLRDLGLTPEERIELADHQHYGERLLERIRSAAERTGASFVVTTEKDAVKLTGRVGLPLLTVRLAVEVEEPEFFPFLAGRVGPGPERP